MNNYILQVDEEEELDLKYDPKAKVVSESEPVFVTEPYDITYRSEYNCVSLAEKEASESMIQAKLSFNEKNTDNSVALKSYWISPVTNEQGNAAPSNNQKSTPSDYKKQTPQPRKYRITVSSYYYITVVKHKLVSLQKIVHKQCCSHDKHILATS